jgi:hypothetical protein
MADQRRRRPTTTRWTQKRRLRLLRTAAILIVILLVAWQCTGDDDESDPTRAASSTTAAPTNTVVLTPASTATAVLSDRQLPAVSSQAGAAPIGGKILIAGGLGGAKNSTKRVWSFDPVTGLTKSLDPLPEEVHTPAVASLGDRVLSMGGGKAKRAYDSVLSITASGQSSTAAKLPLPRTNGAAITSPDGVSVYLVGGHQGDVADKAVLRTTDGKKFEKVATLLHPSKFPAVAMIASSIWVIGGEFNNASTPVVQRIDLASGTVKDVVKLPKALTRASAFVLGGSVFVAGGRTPDGRSNQILRIDPVTNAVTVAGALPKPLSDSTVAVLGSTAYLFGGLAPEPTKQIVTITVQ